MTPLQRIEALHVKNLVTVPGRGTAYMCRSCTREAYPCPTLRIVDQMKAEAR